MLTYRLVLAAAAVLSTSILSAPAEARHRPITQVVTDFCGDRVCARPDSGGHARNRAGRAERQAGRRGVAAARVPRGGSEVRQAPSRASNGESGLITVSTAAGIDIKVSSRFSSMAQAVIAGAVSEGMKFRRINCFSLARSHRSRSNHKGGDACDSYPSIPARIVRAAGARSGCDFADCQHFDNAENVGGMAFWNSVKHRGTVTASAERRHHRIRHVKRGARQASASFTTEFSPRARHDGCSRRGDAAGIGCQLRRWVRCPAGSVKVTQHPYRKGDRYCRWDASGSCMIAAHWTHPKGTRLLVSNPASPGEQLYITIGDKGPAPATTAKLDFSPFAAQALGYGRGSGCAVIH